jgi:hypothetical protein
MNKWYTKLFHRLPNISILNAKILYRNNARRTDQLSFRVQSVELFVKYATLFCGSQFLQANARIVP